MDLSTKWIAIRLWGDSLEPENITRILGVEPESSHRKGDFKILPDGKRTKPKEQGSWSLIRTFDQCPESTVINMLNLLHVCDIKELPLVEQGLVDIYYGITNENSELERACEFHLSPLLMQRLSSLSLGLRVTVA